MVLGYMTVVCDVCWWGRQAAALLEGSAESVWVFQLSRSYVFYGYLCSKLTKFTF